MKAALSWLSGVALVLLVTASLLTIVQTDWWWLRLLDFPRLQLLIGLLVGGAVFLTCTPLRTVRFVIVSIGWAIATAYNVAKLAPFTAFANVQTIAVDSCPSERQLRILVANVKSGNEQSKLLLDLVRSSEPDLFLALETDSWWDDVLDALAPSFVTHVKQVADASSHFGIHLYSQLPLPRAEVAFLLDNGVPSIFASVLLRNETLVDFYGLHPRPPLLWQPSTNRDAQLLMGALEARDAESPVIVAGDFNAVPWEKTFQRMQRIGGFLDPRAGRGLFNSYHVKWPGVAWPLDHVLWQADFSLVAMRLGSDIGSDHYPILVDLCQAPDKGSLQPPAKMQAGDLEAAQATISAATGD